MDENPYRSSEAPPDGGSPVSPGSGSPGSPGNRKELWAWALFDWAHSAFPTLSITITVGYIKEVVFPVEQYGQTGGLVYSLGIAFATLFAGVISPVTGAMADARATKHRWLIGASTLGAFCAMLLGIVPTSMGWLIAILFTLATMLFELTLGYYNSFLPDIADDDSMDRVSAWGFAMGYIGGGLALAVAIAITMFGDRIGIVGIENQLRCGLILMGGWWFLFSLPALFILRDRREPRAEQMGWSGAVKAGFREVKTTLLHIRSFSVLALFMLAYLFYNDGVQTVVSQASQFALEDLKMKVSELTGVVLMIQFLAMPGALAIAALAGKFGQKETLLGCLVIWIVLCLAAFITTEGWQFWILGAVLAMVMGGTQSLSRSVMGTMTPREHAAEFFGFYSLTGKATSFLGAAVFAGVYYWTGATRLAIVSLLAFFIIGMILLARVDIRAGRKQARGAAGADEIQKS